MKSKIDKHIERATASGDALVEFILNANAFDKHQVGDINPELHGKEHNILSALKEQAHAHKNNHGKTHLHSIRKLRGEKSISYTQWSFKKTIDEMKLSLILEEHSNSSFLLKWWVLEEGETHRILPHRGLPIDFKYPRVKEAILSRSKIDYEKKE